MTDLSWSVYFKSNGGLSGDSRRSKGREKKEQTDVVGRRRWVVWCCGM